ncbi:MAG: hypothetical protein P8Y66_09170 [Nitrospirota bacterium]|jgi:hypothetical protein
MRYLRCNGSDGQLLGRVGVRTLYAELDEAGTVVAEVGVDEWGLVVHRYPSRSPLFPFGEDGLLGGRTMDASGASPAEAEEAEREFKRLWPWPDSF